MCGFFNENFKTELGKRAAHLRSRRGGLAASKMASSSLEQGLGRRQTHVKEMVTFHCFWVRPAEREHPLAYAQSACLWGAVWLRCSKLRLSSCSDTRSGIVPKHTSVFAVKYHLRIFIAFRKHLLIILILWLWHGNRVKGKSRIQ